MELNTEQLNIIFPFHVLVDKSLIIKNFGIGLKKISPDIYTFSKNHGAYFITSKK